MNMLKTWMEIVDYRITDGSDYNDYKDAYSLDSWNGEQNGYSFSVIFSTKTQEVYEVQAHDYENNRAYRWISPDWRDNKNTDCQAWDDVNFVDLEVIEDFFEKMSAIYKQETYDTRVRIPINLTDDELLIAMTMAHERDITFNQYVTEALKFVLERKNTTAF